MLATLLSAAMLVQDPPCKGRLDQIEATMRSSRKLSPKDKAFLVKELKSPKQICRNKACLFIATAGRRRIIPPEEAARALEDEMTFVSGGEASLTAGVFRIMLYPVRLTTGPHYDAIRNLMEVGKDNILTRKELALLNADLNSRSADRFSAAELLVNKRHLDRKVVIPQIQMLTGLIAQTSGNEKQFWLAIAKVVKRRNNVP